MEAERSKQRSSSQWELAGLGLCVAQSVNAVAFPRYNSLVICVVWRTIHGPVGAAHSSACQGVSEAIQEVKGRHQKPQQMLTYNVQVILPGDCQRRNYYFYYFSYLFVSCLLPSPGLKAAYTN